MGFSAQDTQFSSEVMSIRDPFKMPKIITQKTAPQGELEQFAIHTFQVTGVITGPGKIRAMILDPNGKTHFVSKDDKIGLKKGVIHRITREGVQIMEKVVNVLGQEELVMTELKIPVGTGGGVR